jgi:transposase
VQKLIESANLKLGQVATDVLGASGRLMLRALADGEQDSFKLAEMARGKLTKKKGELRRALKWRLTSAQRFVLGELLKLLDELSAAVERVNEQLRLQVETNAEPFVSQAVTLLETIPGIGRRMAETIVSEIGVDMSRFPTDAHFAYATAAGSADITD